MSEEFRYPDPHPPRITPLAALWVMAAVILFGTGLLLSAERAPADPQGVAVASPAVGPTGEVDLSAAKSNDMAQDAQP